MSNQKAQSFGKSRMVLVVPAVMLREFVLLSQEVINWLKAIFSATLERTGSNEIGRLLLGTS